MTAPSSEPHFSFAQCIVPNWQAPSHVKALTTTRAGGVSTGAFATMNLKLGEDDPIAVTENRRRLSRLLPREPTWLRMVHGVAVVDADVIRPDSERPEGDAMVSHKAGVPCVVSTADCLPVFLCDRAGTAVAVAHAGWRGLAAGVIEATVRAMRPPANQVIAHLGPAIGPQHFEVRDDVRDAFVSQSPSDAAAFVRSPLHADRYLADLYALARARLLRLGIHEVSGGEYCTYRDQSQFFSYRREARSGRMASAIWIAAD